MKKIFILFPILMLLVACERPSSDSIQQQTQEKLLREGTAQTGMPAIINFRERKMLKDIIELRDQAGLVTYTYLWNEFNGRKIFLCDSVGYGIPYATQYTSPLKDIIHDGSRVHMALPQADPNGLFSPSSAEGTWIMCKDPHNNKIAPVYVEPRIIVQQWRD